MPIAWYLIPYRTTVNPPGSFPLATRTLDLSLVVNEPDSLWDSVEVAGDQAIVKVATSQRVLDELDGLYQRLLDYGADLATTTVQEQNELRAILTTTGKTAEEIDARYPGGLSQTTMTDVLRFMTTGGRIPPRLNPDTQQVVFDRASVPCESVDGLAARDMQKEIDDRARARAK